MDFIQQFNKGMAQDFQDQPPGTFFRAYNFQLVSDTENTYSVESHRGNKYIFSVTREYVPYAANTYGNKLLIFSVYRGPLAMNNGEVGIATFDRVGETGVYVPYYNHQDLDFNIQKQIEAVWFQENSLTAGTYWVDDLNVPRHLNTNLPIFTTHVIALVVGASYMALGGTINYNGTNYGPNEAAGTVFTAVVGAPTFTVITTGAFVINYYPVELVDWTPKELNGRLRLKQWIAGTALCGSYVFLFRYGTNDGYFTPFSGASFPIHVASPQLPSMVGLLGYQAHQGHSSLTHSINGIRLILEGVDQLFSRVQIAMVRCIDINVFDTPKLIFDVPISGADMTFDYTGTELLQELTQDDLDARYVNFLTVGTITTVNNILFPARVTLGKTPNWNAAQGVTMKCIQDLRFADGTVLHTAYSGTPHGSEAAASAIGPSGIIRKDTMYRVYDSAGGTTLPSTVTYNAVVYNTGDSFIGVAGVTVYTPVSGGSIIKAVLRNQLYVNGVTPVYQYIPIEDDFYDNKGMTVDHYRRSYWRRETYRLAIVLDDLIGNPSYALFLGDKTIPAMARTSNDIDPDNGQLIGFNMTTSEHDFATASTLLRHIGIQVSNINFQDLANQIGIPLADLPLQFSGFRIVRAERDPRIMAQGVLYACVNRPPTDIVPMGWEKIGGDSNIGNGRAVAQYAFYCPEWQHHFNNPATLPSGKHVDIEDYYSNQSGDSTDIHRTIIPFLHDDYIGLSKYQYKDVPTIGAPIGTSRLVSAIAGLVESEPNTGAPINSGGLSFQNLCNTNAIPNPFGSTNYHAYSSVGCRCSVLNIDDAGLVVGMGEFDTNSYKKPIVNIIDNAKVPYGGSGAANLANMQYMNTGHYQRFDAAFMTALANSGGFANGIDIWGGDCFVNLYAFHRVQQLEPVVFSHGIVVVYPFESNINVGLHEGRTAGTQTLNSFPTTVDQYIYNGAYSEDRMTTMYPALPLDFQDNNEFFYRTYPSGKKTPGEPVDNFRLFDPNVFKDVNGQNGPIRNIRNKNMKLYYFQDYAIGGIPVNERAAVPNTLGEALDIGEGGVAQRYDERTSFYGNQHQFGLVETPDGFAWYDMHRRAYCYLDTSGALDELSSVGGMESFFANILHGNVIIDDTPVYGFGISGGYDPRFKRVYHTFRINTQEAFTIGFDFKNKQFAGFFPFTPGIYFNIDQHVLTPAPHKFFQPLFTTIFGITIALPIAAGQVFFSTDGYYYVALNDMTRAFVVDPKDDPVNFVRIYQATDIFLHNRNDIGKFYNVVYDEEFIFMLSGGNDIEKVFDNMEWRASQIFFDDITYTTDNPADVFTDVDVKNSPEYAFRNRKWFNNIPYGTAGRMINFQLRVRAVKKNRLNGSVLNSKNEILVLSSVISKMRKAF